MTVDVDGLRELLGKAKRGNPWAAEEARTALWHAAPELLNAVTQLGEDRDDILSTCRELGAERDAALARCASLEAQIANLRGGCGARIQELETALRTIYPEGHGDGLSVPSTQVQREHRGLLASTNGGET